MSYENDLKLLKFLHGKLEEDINEDDINYSSNIIKSSYFNCSRIEDLKKIEPFFYKIINEKDLNYINYELKNNFNLMFNHNLYKIDSDTTDKEYFLNLLIKYKEKGFFVNYNLKIILSKDLKFLEFIDNNYDKLKLLKNNVRYEMKRHYCDNYDYDDYSYKMEKLIKELEEKEDINNYFYNKLFYIFLTEIEKEIEIEKEKEKILIYITNRISRLNENFLDKGNFIKNFKSIDNSLQLKLLNKFPRNIIERFISLFDKEIIIFMLNKYSIKEYQLSKINSFNFYKILNELSIKIINDSLNMQITSLEMFEVLINNLNEGITKKDIFNLILENNCVKDKILLNEIINKHFSEEKDEFINDILFYKNYKDKLEISHELIDKNLDKILIRLDEIDENDICYLISNHYIELTSELMSKLKNENNFKDYLLKNKINMLDKNGQNLLYYINHEIDYDYYNDENINEFEINMFDNEGNVPLNYKNYKILSKHKNLKINFDKNFLKKQFESLLVYHKLLEEDKKYFFNKNYYYDNFTKIINFIIFLLNHEICLSELIGEPLIDEILNNNKLFNKYSIGYEEYEENNIRLLIDILKHRKFLNESLIQIIK